MKDIFKSFAYKAICVLFSILMISSAVTVGISAEEAASDTVSAEDNSYFYYYEKYTGNDFSDENITVFDNGQNPSAINSENKTLKIGFTVKQSARYAVCMNYTALQGNGNDITFSLTFDNQIPFRESESLTLERIWQDELQSDGTFYKDSVGNDRLPNQIEINEPQSKWLVDRQGMYNEPYQYYLETGNHTLEIAYADGDFNINGIVLGQPDKALSYSNYLSKNKDNEVGDKQEPVKIEAALTYRKNNSGIYPLTDKSNASTLPNNPGVTSLNSIGGSNWCYNGDSVSWKCNVPVSGWYKIAVKARQNLNQGMNSYRNIKIDGEVPFEESELLCFPYGLKWQVYELGEKEPYLYYFSEGEHILTMDCVPGKLGPSLRKLNRAVLDLNSLYRDIVVVTGTSPDVYKDYNLETVIEDLVPRLKKMSASIDEIADEIEKVVSGRDTQASVLDEMSIMLKKMADTPYTIPVRLSEFKGNTESLGSLILALSQQPLTVDYIELVPEGKKADSGKISFFDSVSYSIKSFAYSFTDDYSSFDTEQYKGKTPVNVWVSSGRDQVKIINQMVSDIFVSKTGIPVSLNMVDTSTTLIQATLAGKGPDVALLVPQDTPVNLASRGALVDLSKFNMDALKNEIGEQAFIPFEYNSGVYALPESQTFHMLFYRTDIFNEFGLEVPNTWDDFYKVMNILQFNNLEVGIAEINKANAAISLAANTFKTLLYQNGGRMFAEDLKKTALDNEIAYKTFETTAKLYTDHGIAKEYDFFNRFRTGEMAMAIEYYSAYNQLKAAAPEINGLWSFAPIPATVGENGELNRSEVSTVTGCIMLKSAVKKGIEQEAWSFISWWAGAEAQSYYANMLESTMGILGRYSPANRTAFKSMRWTHAESELIMSQWDSVICIPEIPGNYSIDRSITSALRASINDEGAPRRELALYNKDINNEITRKRKEFGLP